MITIRRKPIGFASLRNPHTIGMRLLSDSIQRISARTVQRITPAVELGLDATPDFEAAQAPALGGATDYTDDLGAAEEYGQYEAGGESYEDAMNAAIRRAEAPDPESRPAGRPVQRTPQRRPAAPPQQRAAPPTGAPVQRAPAPPGARPPQQRPPAAPVQRQPQPPAQPPATPAPSSESSGLFKRQQLSEGDTMPKDLVSIMALHRQIAENPPEAGPAAIRTTSGIFDAPAPVQAKPAPARSAPVQRAPTEAASSVDEDAPRPRRRAKIVDVTPPKKGLPFGEDPIDLPASASPLGAPLQREVDNSEKLPPRPAPLPVNRSREVSTPGAVHRETEESGGSDDEPGRGSPVNRSWSAEDDASAALRRPDAALTDDLPPYQPPADPGTPPDADLISPNIHDVVDATVPDVQPYRDEDAGADASATMLDFDVDRDAIAAAIRAAEGPTPVDEPSSPAPSAAPSAPRPVAATSPASSGTVARQVRPPEMGVVDAPEVADAQGSDEAYSEPAAPAENADWDNYAAPETAGSEPSQPPRATPPTGRVARAYQPYQPYQPAPPADSGDAAEAGAEGEYSAYGNDSDPAAFTDDADSAGYLERGSAPTGSVARAFDSSEPSDLYAEGGSQADSYQAQLAAAIRRAEGPTPPDNPDVTDGSGTSGPASPAAKPGTVQAQRAPAQRRPADTSAQPPTTTPAASTATPAQAASQPTSPRGVQRSASIRPQSTPPTAANAPEPGAASSGSSAPEAPATGRSAVRRQPADGADSAPAYETYEGITDDNAIEADTSAFESFESFEPFEPTGSGPHAAGAPPARPGAPLQRRWQAAEPPANGAEFGESGDYGDAAASAGAESAVMREVQADLEVADQGADSAYPAPEESADDGYQASVDAAIRRAEGPTPVEPGPGQAAPIQRAPNTDAAGSFDTFDTVDTSEVYDAAPFPTVEEYAADADDGYQASVDAAIRRAEGPTPSEPGPGQAAPIQRTAAWSEPSAAETGAYEDASAYPAAEEYAADADDGYQAGADAAIRRAEGPTPVEPGPGQAPPIQRTPRRAPSAPGETPSATAPTRTAPTTRRSVQRSAQSTGYPAPPETSSSASAEPAESFEPYDADTSYQASVEEAIRRAEGPTPSADRPSASRGAGDPVRRRPADSARPTGTAPAQRSVQRSQPQSSPSSPPSAPPGVPYAGQPTSEDSRDGMFFSGEQFETPNPLDEDAGIYRSPADRTAIQRSYEPGAEPLYFDYAQEADPGQDVAEYGAEYDAAGYADAGYANTGYADAGYADTSAQPGAVQRYAEPVDSGNYGDDDPGSAPDAPYDGGGYADRGATGPGAPSNAARRTPADRQVRRLPLSRRDARVSRSFAAPPQPEPTLDDGGDQVDLAQALGLSQGPANYEYVPGLTTADFEASSEADDGGYENGYDGSYDGGYEAAASAGSGAIQRTTDPDASAPSAVENELLRMIGLPPGTPIARGNNTFATPAAAAESVQRSNREASRANPPRAKDHWGTTDVQPGDTIEYGEAGETGDYGTVRRTTDPGAAVQRSVPDSAANTSSGELQTPNAPQRTQQVEKLAKAVYQIIKDRLKTERERQHGRR